MAGKDEAVRSLGLPPYDGSVADWVATPEQIDKALRTLRENPSRYTYTVNCSSDVAANCTYTFDSAAGSHRVTISELAFGQAGLGYRLSPSGLVLARVCCTLQPRIAGRRVLELGAGIGLPGLLCASLGAAEVVLTDYHPNLLTHLDQQTVHGAHCPVMVKRLDWMRAAAWDGNPDISRAGGKYTDQAADQSSYEHLGHDDAFDLVLGGDILYEPEFAAWLPKVLKRHLKVAQRPRLVDGCGFIFTAATREPAVIQTFVDNCVACKISVCMDTLGVANKVSFECYAASPDCTEFPKCPLPPENNCVVIRGWR